jgi:hypothetical protein
MKNQIDNCMNFWKNFMRKNGLLIVSVKVLKLLLVLFLFSCESKPGPTLKELDTIRVDSINGNSPEDSVNFKNEDEDEDKKQDEEQSPVVPAES